jgi:hypothetical protein
MENKGLVYSLLFVAILSGAFCLWSINSGTPTPKESLLLAFILTISTTIASLLITQYYAEKSSRRELRTFAKKAAEKVTNLSKQMDMLSVSLQQELDESDYESPKEALQAREMTIESTVRMLSTLKSVNDGSLSDWQGVIGQEITAQRQEREKQEEELRVIVERLGELGPEREKRRGEHDDEDEDEQGNLRNAVEGIKRDVRLLAAQVGGVPVRRRLKPKSPKEQVQRNCPNCGSPVVYKQRARINSFKLVTCPECERHLYSRFGEAGFVLSENTRERVEVQCLECDGKLSVELGIIPGSAQLVLCTGCNRTLQARRLADGVSVGLVDADESIQTIPEDLIQKVREAMPPQPWPDGAAAVVSKNLGIPKKNVSSALTVLIRRGVFKVQVDGRLYAPIEAPQNGKQAV